MSYPSQGREHPLGGPAADLPAVTPGDPAGLPACAVAFHVLTGGRLSVVTARGNTREPAVADFSVLPLGVRRARAAGTSAAGSHAFVQA